VQADALPDDPGLLKAMLIAERMESERLRQIVREFQRHRFGRRAESLSEDQLQLALEDTEQEAASGQAGSEQKSPAERKARAARRRTNRGALPAHLPRIETVVDVTSTVCPCPGGLGGAVRPNDRGSRPRCDRARRCASAPRWRSARGRAWQARRTFGAHAPYAELGIRHIIWSWFLCGVASRRRRVRR
jgi:hypothetical protein